MNNDNFNINVRLLLEKVNWFYAIMYEEKIV
ncbi:hypothetical protein BCD93_001008 [Clostridium saccharoperbutylacetonicum]|nr:hypothetical protein [Clostridium saccharoperbutylacetonicum]